MVDVSTARIRPRWLRAITFAPERQQPQPCAVIACPGDSLWITLAVTSTMLLSTGANAFPTAEKGDRVRTVPAPGTAAKKSPHLRIATTPPAWAACLAAFQQELTPQQFATWIRPLACADDAGKLKLIAPNRFVLQWVKDRFGSRIEALALQATGTPVNIDFALAEGIAAPSVMPRAALPAPGEI